MIITTNNLALIFQSFNAAFRRGLETAPSHYRKIAMTVPSSTGEEVYGWLGQFPGMREWIGARVIKSVIAHGFTIKNAKFENTIGISRDAIEDDRYGVFSPMIQEMGLAAANHPDQLVFGLLGQGFATNCYDGQFFFDTDHPVGTPGGDYPVTSVSNMQAGSGTPWYLLDTSRALKPFVWQERIPYNFTRLDRENDENVFINDEYIYGVRARGAAGFGLWQLAFGSKAELSPANYQAARAAMMSFKGDEGRPLNIKPDTLVVPPSLEGAAMRLVNNGTRIEVVEDVPVSIQNEWAGTAKPIVTAWVN